MRKRNIKSVAHWVIMSILLLFPVLMVGISAFANDEQSVTVTETTEYLTNEVNCVDDIIQDHIYKLNGTFTPDSINGANKNIVGMVLSTPTSGSAYFENFDITDNYNDSAEFFGSNNLTINFNGTATAYFGDLYGLDFTYSEIVFTDCYFVVIDIYGQFISEDFQYYGLNCFGASDYLGQVTTDVDIQNASYKQEVNNWANGFKNLPVNQWYGNLLNTIGVGQTDNSVMNVIYVYPLYVLWVYILDVIVDCFLVIINFGHNALHRLGGDNE